MRINRSLARIPHLFSNVVILTVILGSLTSIILFKEVWPFSHWPMFSGITRDQLVRSRLYGIPVESTKAEIPLLRSFTTPLGEPEVVKSFRRIRRGENGQEELAIAVADCLRRYEQRRVAGKHTGPPLRGIRLYRVTWALKPMASNVDRPVSKELLMEVIVPSEDRK